MWRFCGCYCFTFLHLLNTLHVCFKNYRPHGSLCGDDSPDMFMPNEFKLFSRMAREWVHGRLGRKGRNIACHSHLALFGEHLQLLAPHWRHHVNKMPLRSRSLHSRGEIYFEKWRKGGSEERKEGKKQEGRGSKKKRQSKKVNCFVFFYEIISHV